jgi:cell division protein FtsW (lipid II flippase)
MPCGAEGTTVLNLSADGYGTCAYLAVLQVLYCLFGWRTILKKAIGIIVRYIQKSDMLLLILCCISTVYGIILISSATKSYGTSQYITVQIIALALGIFFMFFFPPLMWTSSPTNQNFCLF